MELATAHREILIALINIHRQKGQSVKGEEIAKLVGRNPGTIRNRMQSLKALSLVESITGPKGGYKATPAAYEALGVGYSGDGEESIVPVVRNGAVVEGVSATEICFNKVTTQESSCLIRILGQIRNFNIEDNVEVGPTPFNKLYICGKVVGLDATMSRLILNVTHMISIPRLPAKMVARRAVRISPKSSLMEASRILVNNGIQEALVEDRIPGLVNLVDITRALAEGRTDLEVREIMTRSFLTIDSEELIIEAIKMLGKTGASQLVVLNNGVLWGFITPRYLMESLTPV